LARHVGIVLKALAHVIQLAPEIASNLTRVDPPAVRKIVPALRIPASELAADISAAIAAAELVAAAVLIPARLALTLAGLLTVFALTLALAGLLTSTLPLSGLLAALLAILPRLISALLLPAGELLDLAAQALHLGQLLIPLILTRALLGSVIQRLLRLTNAIPHLV
jgi:hypothetical protein